MSDLLQSIAIGHRENPYVTFDSQGKGVSRLYEETWDFTSHQESEKKIRFTSIPQEHRTNVQRYVFVLFKYCRKKNPANHVTVSQVDKWKLDLWRLIKSSGTSDFSLLSKDSEWIEVKAGLKGIYAKKTIIGLATTINKLDEAGLVNRHVSGEEIALLASDRQEKQHIAFPPDIHAQVLEKVVNTVDTYYTFRVEISQVMQQAIEIRESYRCEELKRLGVTEFGKKAKKSFADKVVRKLNNIQHTIPDFKPYLSGSWINYILKDCLMAVGLFSGARRTELIFMNPDSFDVISGVHVLQGLTSKGNEGVPIAATWVSHPIAEKALKLAYDMTWFNGSDQPS